MEQRRPGDCIVVGKLVLEQGKAGLNKLVRKLSGGKRGSKNASYDAFVVVRVRYHGSLDQCGTKG